MEAPIARKADVDGDDHLVCHSDNQFVFIGLMLGYLVFLDAKVRCGLRSLHRG